MIVDISNIYVNVSNIILSHSLMKIDVKTREIKCIKYENGDSLALGNYSIKIIVALEKTMIASINELDTKLDRIGLKRKVD